MPLQLRDPELFGVSHDSLTVSFRVEDGAGPVDAPVRVLVDGELRAVSEGPGTRVVRIDGLPADRELRVELVAAGAPAGPPPSRR
jgi:hypothetical protein